MKKIVKLAMAASLAVGLLAGCGSGSDSTSDSQKPGEDGKFDKPVKITYMTWTYSDRGKALDEWIKECKDKYNIEIDLQNIPTANYSSTFKTKVSAKDVPDIVDFHYMNNNFVAEGAQLNKEDFVDVSDLENVKKFPEEIRDGAVRGGKLFYVPVSTNACGVMYNKKVFKDLNLEIPENIDELHTVMDKLKDEGIAPFAGGFGDAWTAQIIPYIALDTYVFAKDDTMAHKLWNGTEEKQEVKWSELGADGEKAFGLTKEWIDKGYFTKDPIGSDATVASQMLATGKAAMFATGNWQYTVAKDAAPDGTEIGFFALPLNEEGDKPVIPISPDSGTMINAKGTNVEAAKMAMNLYYSADIQKLIITEINGIPTNPEVKLDSQFANEVSEAIDSSLAIQNGSFGGPPEYVRPTDITFDNEVETQSLAAGLSTPKEYFDKLDKAIAEKEE